MSNNSKSAMNRWYLVFSLSSLRNAGKKMAITCHKDHFWSKNVFHPHCVDTRYALASEGAP